MEYKDLTEEIVRNTLIGMITDSDTEYYRHLLGNFSIDSLGNEIYRLPGGGLTNKAGWEAFKKELRNAAYIEKSIVPKKIIKQTKSKYF